MKNKPIYRLLAGGYTSGPGPELRSFSVDPLAQVCTELAGVPLENPSYLALSADGKHVYAVTENPEGPSYLNGVDLDSETGDLLVKNREYTRGEAPCYVALDPEGRFAATANYAGGSISVFPLDAEGKLKPILQLISFYGRGVNPRRQEASHIHCVGFSPDGDYLFASDLGTDNLYRFEVDRTEGRTGIRENTKRVFAVEPGSGPRNFRFSPDGKYLYLITELSGTVMGFSYKKGNLEHRQTILIDDRPRGDSGDVVLAPNGKFLYASIREGHDGIAIFSVDDDTGFLTKTGYVRTGFHPRNLCLSPDGKFLACTAMKDDRIEFYAVDTRSGELTKSAAEIRMPSPACVVFIP